ncbi:helix-turn-helix transcriptional regulator [Sinorhizobium meliloti]|uniref:helix-turn-helix transcriptional regulator n=1 Tax=Rhizobium meliloti TaxID=382 RepID=UPI000FDC1AE2|nr:AlpA family phage regulatory protein [Sinorhizobium meliloti]RVL05659.1 AlpA family phage regulatory protein [Sinorhizobium meliloti]RVN49963.1 AlpA family phage regulatory protein [Sinorhizobium meliloti]
MRLVSAEGLRAKGIEFSKMHIWRLTKAGRFPRPISVGSNRRAWVEDEIDAWIEAKIAERDRADSSLDESS